MRHLHLETAADLRNIQKPPMLISEIIPRGSITFIVGPSYSGKTFFALEAARSVAFGSNFMGKWSPVGVGNVLFIEQDSPKYDTGRALYAMLRRQLHDLYGQPDGSEKMKALSIAWHPELKLQDKEDIKRVILTANSLHTTLAYHGDDELAIDGCSLIILDTFRSLHTAQENDSTEMQAVLDNLKALVKYTGAALIVVHHGPKNPNDYMGIRGSNAIEGSVDNVFRVTYNQRADACTVSVKKARAIQPPAFKYRITTTDVLGELVKEVRVLDPATTSDPTKTIGGRTYDDFKTRCSLGVMNVADLVAWGKECGVSRATIYRWWKTYEEERATRTK